MKIKTEDLEIEFIQQIKVYMYYLFEISIKNNSNKNINFNPKHICCNSGINVLRLDIKKLNDYKLLENKLIEKNQEIKGYIAFTKTENSITNKPKIYYRKNKIILRKLKFVDNKKKKEV